MSLIYFMRAISALVGSLLRNIWETGPCFVEIFVSFDPIFYG